MAGPICLTTHFPNLSIDFRQLYCCLCLLVCVPQPPVRTKVKKGVMESLSRSVSDFRHHNHKVKSSYVSLLGENELEVK